MELMAWAWTLGVLFGALGILAVVEEIMHWMRIRRLTRSAVLKRHTRRARFGR